MGEAWADGGVHLTVPVAVDWGRIAVSVAGAAVMALVAFLGVLVVQVMVSMPEATMAEGMALADWPMLLQGAGMVLVITGVVAVPWVAVSVIGSKLRIKANAEVLELGPDQFSSPAVASITWNGTGLVVTEKDGSTFETGPMKPVDPKRLAAALSKAVGL